MLLPLGGLERVISLFGIALFLGITAYDSQKIGRYYVAYQDDSAHAPAGIHFFRVTALFGFYQPVFVSAPVFCQEQEQLTC